MTRQALARRKTEQALAVIRQGLSRCAEEQADRDRRARQHEIEVERWQQRYSDLQMENQRLRTALNSECIGCSQHSIPQSRSQDMQLQIQLDIAEHKNNMYLNQIEHFQEEMSWLLSNRESMMYTAIQQEQQLIFVIERDRVTIEDLECRVGQLLLLSTTKQLLHETHIAVHGDHQICLQACLPTLQESPSHNKLLAHPNKDMNALSLESTFLCSEDAGEFLAEKACATQQETQEDRLSCVDHQKTDIEFERNSQTASRTQEEHPVQLELLSRETQTEIVSCNQEVRNDAVINSVSNNIDNVQQFLADLATMNQIIVKLEDERQFLEIENQSQNQKRDGYLCHCSEFAVACDSLSRALNSNTYSYHELKSRCDGALICQKTYSDQIAQLSSELEMEKYRNDALDEVSRQLASKVQTSTAVDSDRLKTLEAQQQQLQQQNSQMIIQRDLLLQRLEDAERRLQRSESRCRDMEESLDEADKIRRRLRELSNELEECRDVNAQLQGNCRQGQEKLEKLKEDYALKLSQLGELEIKCDDLCGQILQLQSEKVTLEIDSKSLVERLQAAADLFNNQVASLKVELADQSDRNAQLDLVVDSLNGQLVDAQDCACELDKKVAYLQSCHSQTVQTCDTLRNQIEELQYSKETALDVAMSTKSQLLEAVSRGDLLEKKIGKENLQVRSC
uniref:Uncharacterized protein n=1 Tax=Spongospora subterranea TaxID=70186 RepID=A0A0H5QMA5_9EUKA|eukprot:CRZ03133.1 hypothetical protein [Spongospora subterranea]